jgi:hypothetical protein
MSCFHGGEEGKEVLGGKKRLEPPDDLPLTPSGQGVRQGDRDMLKDAGIPVTVNVAGITAVPDGGKPVNLLQRTQGVGEEMAAVNFQAPVCKKYLKPARQGNRPERPRR